MWLVSIRSRSCISTDATCLPSQVNFVWPMSTVSWTSYPWSPVSSLPLSSSQDPDPRHLQRQDSSFDEFKEVSTTELITRFLKFWNRMVDCNYCKIGILNIKLWSQTRTLQIGCYQWGMYMVSSIFSSLGVV